MLLGSRSADALTLKSLDAQATWTIALSGSSYTGTYTAAGSTQATSGHLLLAYGGSANDAIWQKSDGSARFLSTITLLSDGAQLMVLFDVRIGATVSEVTYDVSAGAVHHVGLDTHDVGGYDEPITENMVFTVDAGIYVREWGIGLRIEDNVLVTADGCENLSATIPWPNWPARCPTIC